MTEPRLKAKIWVQAQVRAAYAQDLMATVARKGDEDAGTVLIKQNRRELGFSVLTPMRGQEGELLWLRATGPQPVPEDKADAYIARQVDRDYDLWVLEIDDRDGRLPFEAKIID